MKKKFLWIGILGTLVVVVIALAFVTTGETRTAASELDGLRTEARQLGLPTTMDEVPQGAIDDSLNAAPLLKQAAERLGIDNAAVADLLVEAAKKPACAFDWTDLQTAGFWNRLKLQECIAVTLERAGQDLSEGNIREFRLRLQAALKVSHLIATVPTDEAFRESLIAERKNYVWMGETMLKFPTSEMYMAFVQLLTLDPRSVKSLLTALRRFVALGNEVAQNREIDGDQKVTWIWAKHDFPTDPWGRDAVEATHLKGSIKLVKQIAEAIGWPGAMKALESTADEWSKDKRPAMYTLRESAGSIRDLGRLAAENDAARRILFVAAAAFRDRMKKGMFPAESPVMGVMELDPFTIKPMIFSNLGTGFYVYSVGPDVLDSAGPVKEGLTFDLDIGFRCKEWKESTATELNKPR